MLGHFRISVHDFREYTAIFIRECINIYCSGVYNHILSEVYKFIYIYIYIHMFKKLAKVQQKNDIYIYIYIYII